jgi:hypothetical protein
MLAKVAWACAVTLMALVALGVAALGFSAFGSPQPPQDASVRIVRIGIHETRWLHNAVVTFQTPDGLSGESIVRLDALSCRVGDTLAAVKQGISVRLKPPGCARGSAPVR